MADLKVPPHNQEAEQSVLGALLIDKDAMVVVAEILKPEHFYVDAHAKIFAAIKNLYEGNKPADLVTLSEELKRQGVYDEIGGTSYLTGLVEMVPTSAHAEHYSQIVRDHAVLRRLLSAASQITQECFEDNKDIRSILDLAEQTVFSISQEHIKHYFLPLKDILVESFDRLDAISKKAGGLRGVPTGFSDLDHKLAGLQDSNLVILASRPGQGKSSLAMNIAEQVAVKEKLPVGIFSLEMSKEELIDRLLVSTADVDAWRLKTGHLEDEDFEKLQEAMGELAEAPLYIDDTAGVNIMEIRTKARRLQMEKGLALLIVDYLQLVRGPRTENRVQEVSEISRSLKNLARELRVPVLAISQLSRAVESRTEKRPQLADLRESGALEQDADVVMFLYREDEKVPEQVKLLIAKHRNGPTGEIDLIFRGDRVRFYSSERRRSAM